MTLKRALQLAAGVSVAVVFLWLTLSNVELRDAHRAMANSQPGCIALAFVAVLLGYSCRVERWRLMLACANPDLMWSACAGPLFAGFAANNVLPFRAGDVMRAFAFNARLGATSGVVLATLFVERLLDLLIILGMFGAALVTFDIDSNRFVEGSGIVLMGLAAGTLALLLFPGLMTPLVRMLARGTVRWAPRFGERIAGESIKYVATLEHLAGRARMSVLMLWSAAAWLAEGCAFWLAALSLPTLTRPLAGWLALPVSAFATLLPSTPGYVGTFDYFTALAMKVVGNDAASATVYAFAIHVVVWLPSTVAGSAYLLSRYVRQQRPKATVG